MIQICLNFMSCWSLHVKGTPFNTSYDRWQTATKYYKAVSVRAIDTNSVCRRRPVHISWHLMTSKKTTSLTTYHSKILIFKSLYFWILLLNRRMYWIECNMAAKTSRYSVGLVGLFSTDNRKLPSPYKKATIASYCLRNIIILATTSEFNAWFRNYSLNY